MRPVAVVASSASRRDHAVAAAAGDGGAYVAALPGDHRWYGFPGAGGRAFSGAATSFGLMVSSAAATGSRAGAGVAVTSFSAVGGGSAGRFGALVTKAAGEPEAQTDEYNFNRTKRDVLLSWKEFEVQKRAVACLAPDQLSDLNKIALMGVRLVTTIMMASRDYTMTDLQVMEIAGRSFRSTALQAKHGYVPAVSLREDARSLYFLYTTVVLRANNEYPAPPLPPEALLVYGDIPAKIADAKVYFDEMAQGLTKLIAVVEQAFWAA